jgi:hypothetical protein
MNPGWRGIIAAATELVKSDSGLGNDRVSAAMRGEESDETPDDGPHHS